MAKASRVKVRAILIVALLGVIPLVSLLPGAQAQSAASQESVDQLRSDVSNLTGLVAVLSSMMQGQSVRTDGLFMQLGQLHAKLNESSSDLRARQDLGVALLQAMRGDNLSLTNLVASIGVVEAGVARVEIGVGKVNATVTAVNRSVDVLDAHMTSDHIRIYEGTHITDSADPNYMKPAYKALAENQAKIYGKVNATEGLAVNVLAGMNTVGAAVDGGFAESSKSMSASEARLDKLATNVGLLKWGAIIALAIGIVGGMTWYQRSRRSSLEDEYPRHSQFADDEAQPQVVPAESLAPPPQNGRSARRRPNYAGGY